MRRLTVMLVGAFALCGVATGAHAQAMNKCQGAKIKDAGKKASCLAGLQAKAEATSTTVDPLKVQKCDAKVSAAYAKLESKAGACNTSGDSTAIENKVDAFVNDLVSELATGGATTAKCQGAKIKDAGKKAQCVTGLQAKVAAAGGTIDPVKLGKCQAKVSAAYAKLESKAGACATSGDSTAIENKVDAFTTDVNNELNVGAATTTTTGSTTTTTIGSCAPIVVGQAIPGTYQLNGATGDPRCLTTATTNRFGACTDDAQCGGTAGMHNLCVPLPWVTADGEVLPFPTGTQTTFIVNAAAAAPGCEHQTCIPCGNPNAACAGIPGCAVSGNPDGCIPRAVQGCCDQPAFIVPVFFVNILGGLCSRVDQYDCGLGVINTSNPQTGDNEVTKHGDTSNPGADCTYGTADDCASSTSGMGVCTGCPTSGTCVACTAAGQGNDYAGKIVTTYGDTHPDADGIQFRLATPELSTTWSSPASGMGSCPAGSKFNGSVTPTCSGGHCSNDASATCAANSDCAESLISQLLLKAEPTTAGATGQFVDLNGDGCKRVGSGFSSALPDGPVTVGPATAGGPLKPQPYNGSTGAVSAAVAEVFSGPNSPIHDIGFVAITPQQPILHVSTATGCSCTPAAACPE